MKYPLPILLLALTSLIAIESCKKDNPEQTLVNTPNNPTGPTFGDQRTVKVMGTVVDEAGNPVSGALVSAGAMNTLTTAGGVFILENTPALENLGYVTVNKPGYFMGSRSFVPGAESNVVKIRLLPKTVIGSLNGAAGGSLQSEGVSLEFDANSFSQNGSPYSGTVYVALNYIDPEGNDFAEEMPGNLLAVSQGNALGLTSYGMIAVDLSDGMGGEVELNEGSTATLRFPLSAGLMNSAPATIDLWSFDEENGYWLSEGQAILEGNEYVAEVSHFSFWNCDAPWSAVVLSGRVVDAAGNPIQGAKVIIDSNNSGSAYDYTAADGSFGGFVPDNENLTITLSIPCGDDFVTVFSSSVGPFITDTDLSDFIVSEPLNSSMVEGVVMDCENNPLVNGFIASGPTTYFLQNGRFSFLACGDNVTLTPYTIFETGEPQTFSLTGDLTDVGELVHCSDIETGTVTDIDGNVYQTIVIGTQEWMAENLRTSTYANGEEIPNVTNNNTWVDLNSGAWCYYDNDIQYEFPFGKLYNWHAASDERNVCPSGWHVPSDEEWMELADFLGGEEVAGGKMKHAGTLYWADPNEGATNESGFSGLPGGKRHNSGGFYNVGSFCELWSATEYNDTDAWSRNLYNGNDNLIISYANRDFGLTVRCLRD